MNNNNDNGASIVGIAKRTKIDFTKPIHLRSGYWALLTAVSASLIEEAQLTIPDPPVPTVYNKDKEREEQNPNDPAYIKAMADATARRGLAATEAVIMFGVVPCDPEGNPIDPPSDDKWLDRLKFMERRGTLDLSGYDFDDPLDREFLFKKYYVVSAPDFELLAKATGLDEEAIAAAQEKFPGN
jgi:hypothetical protein